MFEDEGWASLVPPALSVVESSMASLLLPAASLPSSITRSEAEEVPKAVAHPFVPSFFRLEAVECRRQTLIIIIKRTSRAPHLVWARSASQ